MRNSNNGKKKKNKGGCLSGKVLSPLFVSKSRMLKALEKCIRFDSSTYTDITTITIINVVMFRYHRHLES